MERSPRPGPASYTPPPPEKLGVAARPRRSEVRRSTEARSEERPQRRSGVVPRSPIPEGHAVLARIPLAPRVPRLELVPEPSPSDVPRPRVSLADIPRTSRPPALTPADEPSVRVCGCIWVLGDDDEDPPIPLTRVS